MENLLEKITLYDLLGYMFPGCILNLIIIVGASQQYSGMVEKVYKDYEGGIVFAFFIISYLTGILLSEISASIISLCDKYIKKERKLPRKKCWIGRLLGKIKIDERTGGIEGTGISEKELAAALVNSGLAEGQDKINEKIEMQGWLLYRKYMYGIIQSDEKYRRIHNYASIPVFCKNATTALIVGILVLLLYGNRSYILMAILLLAAVVFAKRGFRFKKKTDMYTIVWFVDKNRTENTE